MIPACVCNLHTCHGIQRSYSCNLFSDDTTALTANFQWKRRHLSDRFAPLFPRIQTLNPSELKTPVCLQ